MRKGDFACLSIYIFVRLQERIDRLNSSPNRHHLRVTGELRHRDLTPNPCHTQYKGPVHTHLQPQLLRLRVNQTIERIIQRWSSRLPPQFLPSPRRDTTRVRSPKNGAPWVYLCNFLNRQSDNRITLNIALSLRFRRNCRSEFTPSLLGD